MALLFSHLQDQFVSSCFSLAACTGLEQQQSPLSHFPIPYHSSLLVYTFWYAMALGNQTQSVKQCLRIVRTKCQQVFSGIFFFFLDLQKILAELFLIKARVCVRGRRRHRAGEKG